MRILKTSGGPVLFTGNAFSKYSVVRLLDGKGILDIRDGFPKTVGFACLSEEEALLIAEYFKRHGELLSIPISELPAFLFRVFVDLREHTDDFLFRILGARTKSTTNLSYVCETKEKLETVLEDLRKLGIRFFYMDKYLVVK